MSLGFPGVDFAFGIEGGDQPVIKIIEYLKILRNFRWEFDINRRRNVEVPIW